jgi:hypothetical protein
MKPKCHRCKEPFEYFYFGKNKKVKSHYCQDCRPYVNKGGRPRKFLPIVLSVKIVKVK